MATLARQSQAATSDARRWTIVCLLSVGMIIAYVDRANISVALAAREFTALFQLSDQDRGMINSAFFWSYALLQIPAGMLVDRFGVKRPYTIAFIFWSAVSAATAAAGSLAQLLALRVLLGVGESLVTPASVRWIRYNIAEKNRGAALGIYMAGTKFGPAIGAYIAAMLVQEYGWRLMFVILGLGGLVWLLPWQVIVRDDDRQLEAAQSTGAPAAGAAVWSSIALWGILLGTFCYNYFVYFSMTWLPAYFVERRGLSLSSMGLYTAFSFGGMAVVAILAGWVADRLIRRGADPVRVRRAFTIAGFALASTEVIGALATSTSVAVFFATASLAGLGLATANYWALTQTLMPGASIGRIAGAQNCASNLSGIAAPLITGWLKESTGTYTAPMQAIWVFLIIGIGSYLFLARPKYAPRV
jgi:ACS family D-galactonate transporter-like MFS transporter